MWRSGVTPATLAVRSMTALGWFGATSEEARMPLPGDDVVSKPMLEVTHAVTIHAPADRVWQWLVQIGQGRAGFYSDSPCGTALSISTTAFCRASRRTRAFDTRSATRRSRPNGSGCAWVTPSSMDHPGRPTTWFESSTRTAGWCFSRTPTFRMRYQRVFARRSRVS